VTVDGVSRPLGDAFTVFATQNPVEHEGTYPLPEAQLDRFLIKTVMPYPTREAELELLARYEGGFDAERLVAAEMKSALAGADAIAIRQLVDAVRVAPEVRVYIADITRSTRDERMLSLGASPRATVALFRAARAAAVLEGRDFVIPDDVKGVTPAVLRHRINLAPELEVDADPQQPRGIGQVVLLADDVGHDRVGVEGGLVAADRQHRVPGVVADAGVPHPGLPRLAPGVRPNHLFQMGNRRSRPAHRDVPGKGTLSKFLWTAGQYRPAIPDEGWLFPCCGRPVSFLESSPGSCWWGLLPMSS